MTVHSSKTEHHEGHETREIPIFPELKSYLVEVFELAEDGSNHVITRYRDTNSNLRTQLTRIIERAGLRVWPKLFQNLRATRQTELEEIFSPHVVSAWIGNSRRVAEKHYLQVTDDHFRKAVQNAVQQAHAEGRTESQNKIMENEKVENCPRMQKETAQCENTEPLGMGDA